MESTIFTGVKTPSQVWRDARDAPVARAGVVRMNEPGHVGQALAGLPAGQRDAFLWRVRDGTPLATIAARLGTDPATAGRLLVAAARRLAPLHGAVPGSDYTWLHACRLQLRAAVPANAPSAGTAPAPAGAPRWLAGVGLAGVLIGLAVIGWPLWNDWRDTQSMPVASTAGPVPAASLPVEDAEAPPLAAADLQLLVDAGDDHALLDDLEFFAWLAERTPDAD